MKRQLCRALIGKSFKLTRELWARDGVKTIPRGATVTVEGTWRGTFNVVAVDGGTYIRRVERGALEGA